MTEEVKRTRKPPKKRKATEMVDFAGEEALQAWLVDKARTNHRTISAEIVHRLAVQMANSEKGKKNLIHSSTKEVAPNA